MITIDMTTLTKAEQVMGKMQRAISELSVLSDISTKALINELEARINPQSFSALQSDFMRLYFSISTEEQSAQVNHD